jgi:hypothetical protein
VNVARDLLLGRRSLLLAATLELCPLLLFPLLLPLPRRLGLLAFGVHLLLQVPLAGLLSLGLVNLRMVLERWVYLASHDVMDVRVRREHACA